MMNKKPQMPQVDPVYYYALVVRNKLVYAIDWLLMRIHTMRTGIEHNGADPRIVTHNDKNL